MMRYHLFIMMCKEVMMRVDCAFSSYERKEKERRRSVIGSAAPKNIMPFWKKNIESAKIDRKNISIPA